MTFRLSCYCSASYLAMAIAWTSAGWDGVTDRLATVVRPGPLVTVDLPDGSVALVE